MDDHESSVGATMSDAATRAWIRDGDVEGCVLHYAPEPCPICAEVAIINAKALDRLAVEVERRRGVCAKLDADQVEEIRERIELGEKQDRIAASYGVSRTTINNIATGRTWSSDREAKAPPAY